MVLLILLAFTEPTHFPELLQVRLVFNSKLPWQLLNR